MVGTVAVEVPYVDVVTRVEDSVSMTLEVVDDNIFCAFYILLVVDLVEDCLLHGRDDHKRVVRSSVVRAMAPVMAGWEAIG